MGEEDVVAAVQDLENLYASVEADRLGSGKFDFMKSELTVHDMNEIGRKIGEQPREPWRILISARFRLMWRSGNKTSRAGRPGLSDPSFTVVECFFCCCCSVASAVGELSSCMTGDPRLGDCLLK